MVREQEYAYDQRDVAESGHDERFHGCVRVHRFFVPESYEQIAAKPHSFPADVQKGQVVREHERQHGRDKQIHVRKETTVPLIVDHVFGRVQVNQETHHRHHEHHEHGQGIEVETQPAEQTQGVRSRKRARGNTRYPEAAK